MKNGKVSNKYSSEHFCWSALAGMLVWNKKCHYETGQKGSTKRKYCTTVSEGILRALEISVARGVC